MSRWLNADRHAGANEISRDRRLQIGEGQNEVGLKRQNLQGCPPK